MSTKLGFHGLLIAAALAHAACQGELLCTVQDQESLAELSPDCVAVAVTGSNLEDLEGLESYTPTVETAALYVVDNSQLHDVSATPPVFASTAIERNPSLEAINLPLIGGAISIRSSVTQEISLTVDTEAYDQNALVLSDDMPLRRVDIACASAGCALDLFEVRDARLSAGSPGASGYETMTFVASDGVTFAEMRLIAIEGLTSLVAFADVPVTQSVTLAMLPGLPEAAPQDLLSALQSRGFDGSYTVCQTLSETGSPDECEVLSPGDG